MGHRFSSDNNNIKKFYKFKETLGSGTFAKVKKAVRRSDKMTVAVKIIDKAVLEKRDLDSLHEEVEIMNKVDHPNCVKLIEMFETPTHLYLVMELLAGGELYDRIILRKTHTEPEAALMLQQVGSALKHLHSLGVTHRDLKPENLLFVSKDFNSSLKITDFGLAKCRPNKGKLMLSCCGTPAYVAPEVLNRIGYTEAVDVWSLGVIFYILLCGFPPFQNDNTVKLYSQIRKGEYGFPSPFWDKVSKEAKDLVKAMITVDPKERITIDEMMEHPFMQQALKLDVNKAQPLVVQNDNKVIYF